MSSLLSGRTSPCHPSALPPGPLLQGRASSPRNTSGPAARSRPGPRTPSRPSSSPPSPPSARASRGAGPSPCAAGAPALSPC